jgi:hypothetical protein
MAKFTNCLQIVNAMPEQDQDALLARLDELQARGMSPKEAQLQAAIDVLAQVEREGQARKSADRVTDTPAFKRWFGDSKVVDAEGKPLVVYHGSSEKSIAVFESEDGRFYFTDSKSVADKYGRKRGARKNAETYAVYLSMQNPEVFDMQGESWYDQDVGADVYNYIMDAMEDGRDGVILENFVDGATKSSAEPSTIYVVFKPAQIKSATDNEGTFDPANPDIRKSSDRDANFKRWSGGAPVIELGDDHEFRSGQPVVVEALHGTTNADLTEFKRSRANPESDMGAGFYASNTPEDVAANYANVDGPDLTQRVELLAERLEEDFDGDMDAARNEARKRLSQGSPNTMKLFMRFKNPAVFGGSGETLLDFNEDYNEETDEYGEASGLLLDFAEALREVAPEYNASDREIESAIGKLFEQAEGEGIKVSEALNTIKSELVDASDDEGNNASSEVFRRALSRIGFDGVIDTTVYGKFGPRMIKGAYTQVPTAGMSGMNDGTVHFIAFEPEQIKSATGNSGEFGENRSILKSVDRPQFYSQLQRAIEGVPDRLSNMGALGWKQWIDSNGPKLGVKKDEIEWSGIKDYLDLQGKKKLSKDDLSAYLDDSGVKVSEVMLGDIKDFSAMDDAQVVKEYTRIRGYAPEANGEAMSREEILDELEGMLDEDADDTRYSQYTLPGGENYRELLITLDGGVSGKEMAALDERIQELEDDRDGADEDERDAIDQRIFAVQAERKKLLGDGYRSSHWDEPNVLAHIRINDRTDADGKRVLFVEEVQSDWGQEGKKKGFKGKTQEDAKLFFGITDADWSKTSEMDREAYRNEMLESKGRDVIPAAPFVTKTEGWLNLALKRISMVAVEGGYDKVAFANGEQSADRYDLSKQIQSIAYSPKEKLLDAWDNNRRKVMRREITDESQLEDYVGKEVAKRLLKQPLVMGKHLLDGEDIKVGGEGMKTFYDQIVPQALNKLLPKLGGEKLGVVAIDLPSNVSERDQGNFQIVQDVETPFDGDVTLRRRMPNGEVITIGVMPREEAYAYTDNPENYTGQSLTQPGFDVTDKMRETVGQGLPLFSRDRTEAAEFKVWSKGLPVYESFNDAASDRGVFKLYHATPKDFNEFKPGGENPRDSGPAIWLASSPKSSASAWRVGNEERGWKEGANIMPVYARLERPLVIDSKDMMDWARAVYADSEFPQLISQKTVDELKADGYDSIIAKAEPLNYGEGNDEIIVFEPTQIKSAIGNDGGFDSSKKDITKSRDRKAPDTKEFKAWFDKSKVVNAKGEPLVMYHGTRPGNDITEFDESDADGIYFTPDPNYAKSFTEDLFDDSGERGAIYPAYLSLQNPYVVRTSMGTDEAESFLYRGLDRRELEGDGHDGAMLYIDGDLDQAMVFKPEQIKSATGNEGAFDATNPDIRKSANRPAWFESGRPVKSTPEDLEKASGDTPYILEPEDFELEWRVARVPLSAIDESSEAPEPAELANRLKSIREVGKLERPIYALRDSGQVEILDGWHRLQIAKERGQKTIEALVGAERAGIRKSTARKPWFEDLSKLKVSTNYQLGDLLKSNKKLNWWNRTVGTQYNLAQRNPEFKRVFDAVQTFINDVSAYATQAADLAPSILPKLDGIRDVLKKPLALEDVKALRDPVFGGTLSYMRDGQGNLIETDDVQKAGVVFTDTELREKFNLNDRQIGLYREFRQATDRSLTDLALSDMVRYLGEDGADIRTEVMATSNVTVAAGVIESHLEALAQSKPARRESLQATIVAIKQKADQANSLMDRGYAPLSRFGQYTVYAVGKGGEQLYFGMFETQRDANKMVREMQEQYPDAEVTAGVMSQESYKLFSGVTPETLALFGESLGLEESGIDPKSEAFQAYLKLAKTNRSAMKRLIQRKGIDGFSEDAGRVLAGFVYSNARQISTNLNAGEIGKAASDVKDGDVKDHAIRLMQYIQNPTEEAQKLKGLLFTVFLGGNISSAAVNLSQTATTTFPYLAQFDSTGKVMKRLGEATKLAVSGIRNDEELKQALKRAEDEGIVSPQEVFALMAQAQGKAQLQSGDGTVTGDALAKTNNFMTKAGLTWGRLFSAAEQANRRIAFIAAYKLARDKNIENPFAFAEKAVLETQFSTNKGIRPVWARGAVGGVLFTFKGFTVSYLELLGRMLGNGPEGKKAFALALGTLFLFAGVGGLPFVDDLDDVIDAFAQRVLGKSFNSAQAKKEFFASIFGQAGAEFVMSGISSLPGAPIDVSGRLGLGNIIPGTGILPKKTSYQRDVMEVLGPAGSLFTSYATAIGLLAQGEVTKAATTAAPLGIQNAIKGLDMATMGFYRDTRGRKVIDTNGWEALAKSMGFQPVSVKQIQEATFTQQILISQNKIRETEIADKMARARIERKPELAQDAREELAEWNRKNPQSPISIDASQINRRVQQAMMEKAKRLEKTAPKEIRDSVKRELERASN